jgi:hypothetical protein
MVVLGTDISGDSAGEVCFPQIIRVVIVINITGKASVLPRCLSRNTPAVRHFTSAVTAERQIWQICLPSFYLFFFITSTKVGNSVKEYKYFDETLIVGSVFFYPLILTISIALLTYELVKACNAIYSRRVR